MKSLPSSNRIAAMAAVLLALSVSEQLAIAQAPVPAAPAAPAVNGPVTTISSFQAAALAALELSLQTQNAALTTARAALNASTFATPANPADIRDKVAALAAAEQALALARADAFPKFQASVSKLGPGQLQTLIAQTGRGRAGGAAGRAGLEPINFQDRLGFTSLYDGTFKNWDGDMNVWHIVDGAITADTVATPGMTFLIWRGGTARDFELKLMVKLVGGGSGIMYRTLAQPSIGNPYNTYGYQFDLGATNAGQLVDQNGRGVLTAVGGVNQFLENRRLSIATVNEPPAISWYKPGEWNEVHIIARGSTLIHLVNGHVMTLSVDEDNTLRPTEGTFALQVEGTGQVYFKDIWLKKL